MANESVVKLKKLTQDAQALMDDSAIATRAEDAWTPWHKFLHFWVMVGKTFVRNRCPVRASALAYASLLALVPMLAVVMSVSSSLLKKNGTDRIDGFIQSLVTQMTPPAADDIPGFEDFPDPEPSKDAAAKTSAARTEVKRRLDEFIGNVRSGTLGVTGMIALVGVAISMLARIEGTFNDIWGVTRGRSWYARVVQYWAALTLGPLFLVVALGLTSGSHLQAARRLLASTPIVGHLIFQILPIIVLSLSFALFYALMPNVKVQWRAALVGGLVGGGLWHLNNVFSVLYVSRVVTNSKIYGSLGMVPIFMIGLYFSWMILLFGAQVAYAYQNRAAYVQARQAEAVNQRGREFIALRLMTAIGRRFQAGARPPTILELAAELAVPSNLTSHLAQQLLQSKLLIEINGAEAAYAPARPLASISAEEILQALRAGAGQELVTREGPERAVVRGEFDRIRERERQAAASITLEAIVQQAAASRAGTPVG